MSDHTEGLPQEQVAELELVGASRRYLLPRSSMFAKRRSISAVENANIRINPGESVGIVGESGSGKTTISRLLTLDDQPTSGRVLFRGSEVDQSDRASIKTFRRNVQAVLQNPAGSFDPRMRVGTALAEPLRALSIDCDHEARVAEVLEQVGMNSAARRKFPHQFSGGQQQRLAIARALISKPTTLIADEPVSALDVSVRAQILNLLRDLVNDLGISLVLIAHDLAVVSFSTDRVYVLSDGRVVDSGESQHVFANPGSDETANLVAAALTLDPQSIRR